MESTPRGVVEAYTPQQKTEYFSRLARKTKSSFGVHVDEGLWVRTADGNRDWGNVSDHCLVEVARAEVFGDLLGLSPDMKNNLMKAAAIHDGLKKSQIGYIKEHGKTYQAFDEFASHSHDALLADGYDETVVLIAGSVGHESLSAIESLLKKSNLDEIELAQLVLHYVDDYTVNADWAQPRENVEGQWINDLDRRMDKNEANPNYAQLNEEGRAHFGGRTAYEAQRQIGQGVETRLAQELVRRGHKAALYPVDLPTIVDAEIKSRISLQRV